MNVKSLIIHLKRATDRQDQVGRIKQTSPVSAEVLDAVDGATLDEVAMQSVYRCGMHEPPYPFSLRTAEVACFMSHRRCWQHIINENLDAALILEDDVNLDINVFYPAFELAMRNFTPSDYVRFPAKRRETALATRAQTSTHELIVPSAIGLGMVGQLVGQGAAAKLLDTTRTFDRPVDTFLQMTWLTGVWPISIYPTGISEESVHLGGSLISKRKSWPERVRREVLRARYRRRLVALAKTHPCDLVARKVS